MIFSRTIKISQYKCKSWTWCYSYAVKTQVKAATGVDTSAFAESNGSKFLKSYVDTLETVSNNLPKFSNVIKHGFTKKT